MNAQEKLLKLLASRGIKTGIQETEETGSIGQDRLQPQAPKVILSLPELHRKDSYSSGEIVLTEEQQLAVTYASQGKEFCLIGAAGTGKTTTVKELVQALIRSGLIHPMQEPTKHLSKGMPGVIFVSFTNRAVNNLARQLPDDIKPNALTCHKALEYAPEYYDKINADGTTKETMRFVATRNATFPLKEIQFVIFEEASMISIELEKEVRAACPNARFIYLGDIYQLPPVISTGILGFKLNELPVVELTKVWRQGLDSGIITLAHKIKNGEILQEKDLKSVAAMKEDIILRPWPKRVSPITLTRYFYKHIREVLSSEFCPETDIMLCPMVKNFGSTEINKMFAQVFGELRNAPVWEVKAGREDLYLAEGDKVMYNKEDYIIKKIKNNPQYVGKFPRKPSITIDRWGNCSSELAAVEEADVENFEMSNDFLTHLNLESTFNELEDIQNQASHIVLLSPIGIKDPKPDDLITLSTRGQMNELSFSYCISVHKSQGSEWRKVYLVFHHSHAVLLSRELVYTAITRAREELVLYYDPESIPDLTLDGTFQKAVKYVEIKGNTLAQKAEYFKGKDYQALMNKKASKELDALLGIT